MLHAPLTHRSLAAVVRARVIRRESGGGGSDCGVRRPRRLRRLPNGRRSRERMVALHAADLLHDARRTLILAR